MTPRRREESYGQMEARPMDRQNDIFIEAIKQNWTYFIHVENERAGSNAFYALLTAGVLAFLAQEPDANAARPLFVVLSVVSLFNFVLSLRLRSVLYMIEDTVEDIAKDFGVRHHLVSLPGYRIRLRDDAKHPVIGFVAAITYQRNLVPTLYFVATVLFAWFAYRGSFAL